MRVSEQIRGRSTIDHACKRCTTAVLLNPGVHAIRRTCMAAAQQQHAADGRYAPPLMLSV